jgi:hypothetical protein
MSHASSPSSPERNQAAKADRAAKKAEKEGKTIVDANAELKAARVVAGETMEAFKAAAAAATTVQCSLFVEVRMCVCVRGCGLVPCMLNLK